MSNIRKLFVGFCALLLAGLVSCGFSGAEKGQESGSLVFDFTGLGENQQAASRASLKEYFIQYDNCFLDLKLEGTYEFAETYDLKKTSIITIADIPVGAQVKAVLEIYSKFSREDNDDGEESREFREIIFTGESELYEIQDGPNEITVTMTRYSGDINDEPEQEDPKVTIYVKYDPNKQGTSTWNIEYGSMPEEEEGLDGQTENTAFNYIQSAIEWIIDNGDGNTNYQILLTGYEKDDPDLIVPFDQGMMFKDGLNGKAKSITLTSSDPRYTALCSSGEKSIYVCTNVKLILKNIKIATKANTTTDRTSLIITTAYNKGCEILLSEGTVLEGSESYTAAYGAAIYIYTGSVTMEKDACIKGFRAKYSGGAVFLELGSFKMFDDSSIQDCHATQSSLDDGGGAIFIKEANPIFTMNDNASISDCSSNYNGGAIYMHGGSFTLNGGSITGCQGRNGGAIYMTAENNEPSIYLEGGTISGCTASTKGSAIFMLRGTAGLPKITLGGDIFVDPENDVYTSSSINILLNNVLTTQNEKAILISYNYNTISTGSKLLKLAEYPYDNEAVSKSHDKVAVRIEQADSTYKTNYYFSDQGALLEQN